MRKYANIIVDISHESLDKTFSYGIPEHLRESVAPGTRVRIPFGVSNREIAGYVLSLTDTISFDPAKVKDIISIEKNDDFVESKLIALAEWMRSNYGSTMINALKTVLPVKKDVKLQEERQIELCLSEDAAREKLSFYSSKHQVARARLLSELIEEPILEYKLVTNKLNIAPATLRLMEEQGVIKVTKKRVYRNPVSPSERGGKCALNTEQQIIIDDFKHDIGVGYYGTYLVHGITGSGKTEVYMEMIEQVVAKGRQAIVLIPEIALTYQTVLRFYKRFGDSVSTLHSRLSQGEKYDQFERAKKGEIQVMIGPRSALFTPFNNIGLIIIDEEHEHTYKSDNMPKYHARDVAEKLCELHKASLVLGSATPSLSSYYKAQQGGYKLYTLKERAVKEAALPKVHIVDLREELKSGNKSIFSRELAKAMEDRLSKNEQTMLFINRRGMDGVISCRACGEPVKCPHCDVSLSRHRNGRLVCHYCGHEEADVKKCPACGSPYISGMRAGTEKVEEAIRSKFPHARVLRMDYDTTRQKGSYEEILSKFANREADILIGTQMIVKGHDFPFVTLMGILAADMSLNANDYRAAERTFDLLTQAAGRAGRGERCGDVIIQTYQPDNYAIIHAANQDYEGFYRDEIAFRSLVGYPPVGHMVAILLESQDETAANECAVALADMLKNDIITNSDERRVNVIGPAEASLKKLNDVYRQIIYIKSKDMNKLIALKDAAECFAEGDNSKNIRITFDFDPMNGY